MANSRQTLDRDVPNSTDRQRYSFYLLESTKDNAVLKRSVVVNQLYGGMKLVVEKQKPTRSRLRADT